MSTNIPEHLRTAAMRDGTVCLPPILDGCGGQVEVFQAHNDPRVWLKIIDVDVAEVRLTPQAATQLAEQIQALSEGDQA